MPIALPRALVRAAELAAHTIWPTRCPICGRLGRVLCDECLAIACGPTSIVCMECVSVLPCALHRDAPRVIGASDYGPYSRAVIHAMKFRGARAIASMLGRELAHRIARPDADLLVPIPLHSDSERGFNQSLLIARAAGAVWGLPVADVLAWSGTFVKQALRSSPDERILPEGAIMMRKDLRRQLRICLVDDVCTTGATIRSARSAAERSGSSVTCAVVWSMS